MIQSVRPFQENIVMLNGSFFFWVVKKGKLTICERSLCDINKAIEAKDLKEQSLEEVIAVQYHNILPIGWYGVDRYASHMSTGDGSSCMAAWLGDSDIGHVILYVERRIGCFESITGEESVTGVKSTIQVGVRCTHTESEEMGLQILTLD